MFVMVTWFVYLEVGTGFLNLIWVSLVL